MRVVPAILTSDKEDFQRKLSLAASFTDFGQVDLMDGLFVPSASVDAAAAGSILPPIDYEAHLMVREPLAWARELVGPRLRRVIFHWEAVSDPADVARELKKSGVEVGIALNPPTSQDVLGPVIGEIDSVLIMSVVPGFYGSPFIPQALEKAPLIRKLRGDITIGLDGGVGPDNIPLARAAGIDYVCVGSRVMLSDDPAGSYARLSRLAD